MTGTFGGINTALSALRYQQVALDVANNNIANVGTDGYVRRRAEAGAVGGTQGPSLWSGYDGHGDGVRTQSVTRLTDALLDVRVRREQGALSFSSARATVLSRVETAVAEPGPDGVAAAMLALRNSLQDLVGDPAGPAARETVLGKAGILASAINAQARNVDAETADQRTHAATALDQVNDAARQLADLNRSIATAEGSGADVATLHDTRDTVALRLATLAGAVTTVQPDGQYAVSLGGVPLVSGATASTLSFTGTAPASGPLAYAVDGTAVTVGGELGGVTDVLNVALPAYRTQLDAIAADFADRFNAQHALGTDLTGTPGGKFFDYDPADPAGTLRVALTSGAQIAASTGGPKDGANADALSAVGSRIDPVTGTSTESAYQSLVTGLGASVAAADRQTANQRVLATSVTEQREQIAGVNLDEETVSMVTAQHAYEAASKVMSVLDSVLDTLINRMAAR